MLITNPSPDPDINRRQTLARVYRLLIQLAEENSQNAPSAEAICEQPKTASEDSLSSERYIDHFVNGKHGEKS